MTINNQIIKMEIRLPAEPPTLPPKKTWWEKLLEFITAPLLKEFLRDKLLWQQGYKLLTGKEMTDEEFILKKLQFADWVVPINLLLKLTTGKNLKGEAEEFGSASDWIEASIYLVGAIIPGQVDETIAKFGLKAITKTQADELVVKMGSKAVIDGLKRTVKANPETSAKFLSKFPVAVRNAVISGLGRTAYGKEVIYILGKTGYFKYTASIWKKATSILFKASAPILAITLPIFAIAEIPNMFNMIQFARKQRLEAEGKWPSGIAFKLNDFEDLLKSYTYTIDNFIREGKKSEAIAALDDLRNTFQEYQDYIAEKYPDMLPENYDLALLSIGFYADYITDRLGKTGEMPAEPPEIPTTGTLILSVEPTDAIIEVAGQPEINTSGTYELSPGSYIIKASKENHWDKSSTAIIKAGEETRTSIILIPTTEPMPEIPPEEVRGTLTISVTPEDALIEVAGKEEITTSGTYELAPGSYSVRASKEDFVSDIKTVFVTEKEDKAVSFILKAIVPVPPVEEKATITITSTPTNTDVYIDGVYKWTTTPYTILLDEGAYFIRVQADGYFPIEIEIEVEAGEVAELPFILDKIPEPEIPSDPYIPQTPYYPDYVPADPYIPNVVTTSPGQIPPSDYNLLYEPTFMIAEPGLISKPTEGELLINIETTDLYPWKGRIYSIALLELSTPEAEPKILIGNNEEELIRMFLDWFEAGNYSKLVGFKLSFDHRFLFAKMMLYRMQSKKFKDIALRDVKQIMDQVKEEFVYFPSKVGTLDDWGKMLLGRGKYGSQELMLRKYISGDFDYVNSFQLRQIELTRDLYNLARFSMGEAFISQPSPVTSPISTQETPETTENPGPGPQTQCQTCFAYLDKTTGKCPICEVAI